ncbi:bifunctional phosphoribosylaminoimidazolecarboxamide formyltransferase/IMP cyclohydrolase [Candidatus Sumerlaeota bacterium]|nr:bifunctional phosphoribosylaminoimidazolecarboxamide formyltransferase/IMP cyclohydrolase [Candidatus Sumerlaeota bacterium]
MLAMKTALISVYDKTGLEDLATFLHKQGVQLLSTGGTLKFLRDCGLPALSVADYTEQPEILDGRVKTLHPKIFGGILARRANPADMTTLADAKMAAIDYVIVTLYPFVETMKSASATESDIIEKIDIGGVSLLRAAAKNFRDVAVVAQQSDYEALKSLFDSSLDDNAKLSIRKHLAAKAIAHTSAYDAAITSWLGKDFEPYPDTFSVGFSKLQDLRYGENPHQSAAFYRDPLCSETCVANAKQLHGKELSYNNILDLDAALEIARSFPEIPTVVIVKHNNPCGVACSEDLVEAWNAARACDPTSAYGGITAVNRPVTAALAEKMAEIFLEAIIAPSFEPDALAILEKKKNLRLLDCGGAFTAPNNQKMVRSVIGGALVQDRDMGRLTRDDLKVVSKAQPTEEDLQGLLFAWKIAKFVKSNAIIYTNKNATIGIGAGQMSRIDSTKIAATKAQSPVRGAYMASDAFFPFRDNVDLAADIGIKAIISPGGSIRDEEVLAAADEHGIIMVFTGMRHFRH